MATKSGTSRRGAATPKRSPDWQLRLYVTSWEPRSTAAMSYLKTLCDQRLPGTYRIQIVDLVKSPRRSVEDQILAIPTVVRRFPLPERRVIGTLSNADAAAAALEMSGVRSNLANRAKVPKRRSDG